MTWVPAELPATLRLPTVPRGATPELRAYLNQLHHVLERLQVQASRAVAVLNQYRYVTGTTADRPAPTGSKVLYVSSDDGQAWVDVGTWVLISGEAFPDLSSYAIRDTAETFTSVTLEDGVTAGGDITTDAALEGWSSTVGDELAGNFVFTDEEGYTLYGEARRWNDMRVGGMQVKPGSSSPTWAKYDDDGAGSTGVFLYRFDDASTQDVFFTIQLSHEYTPGTDIYMHVHWIPHANGAASETVVWELEYFWHNVGEDFDADTTVISVADDGPFTIREHTISAFPAITGTGMRESSVLVCRLSRKAAAAADDYAGWAWLLSVDAHFQVQKAGTTEQYPGGPG